MQLNEEIAFKPISDLGRGRLINLHCVAQVALAFASVRVDLKVLNPGFLFRDHHFSFMVSILNPVERAFALLWDFVKVQILKLHAISLIDVDPLDVVEQAELKLKADIILNRNQFRFGDLEGIFGDVTQVSQSCLHSLVSLLLRILLSLCEGGGSIEDAQRLESLLEDLTIVRGDAHRISLQVEHLDVIERLQECTGTSEVTQLVEGDIETEQVGEVGRDRLQGRCLEHVIGHSEMN